MTPLFISHSSQDDDFVRTLQQALRDYGQDVWIDSRKLRGGNPLWSEIQKTMREHWPTRLWSARLRCSRSG